MDNSWGHARYGALDSVETFASVLSDQSVDDRRLINGYLETKRRLAKAFEVFAMEKYADPEVLSEVLGVVQSAMERIYAGLPAKYLRVRGFGQVHSLLLAYLVERVGLEVSADELRMLTADAVHTERRARDLRDLGFELLSYEQSGRQVYVLTERTPDVARGAELLLRKNIREDKTANTGQKGQLLREAGLAE